MKKELTEKQARQEVLDLMKKENFWRRKVFAKVVAGHHAGSCDLDNATLLKWLDDGGRKVTSSNENPTKKSYLQMSNSMTEQGIR